MSWRDARGRTRARLTLELLERRELLAVTISGNVFQALNVADPGNDSPNPGPPIANVMVSLDNGAMVQPTNATGGYTFTGVAPGSHTVSVVRPSGFLGFSAQALSYRVNLADNSTFANLNFGLTPRTEALVQNLFERVLNRPADAARFNGFVTRINQGESVAVVYQELLALAEFRTVVAPVGRILSGFYPDQPIDANLLRRAVGLQDLGVGQDASVLDLLYSRKFVAAFGDSSKLDNSAYVTFLFQRLIGRDPTPDERATWLDPLNAGTLNRGQVAQGIANSPLFTQARPTAAQGVAVSLAYLGVLGRPATQAEFNAGLGMTIADVVTSLVNSAEYANLTGFPDTFLADVAAQPLEENVSLLSRLQIFNPTTGAFDTAVTAGSLKSTTAKPVNLYVIAHGWAPGYENTVLLHSTPGNPLKWWQTVQFPGGVPPEPDSPWMFAGVDQISVTGLAQAIANADPHAQVVAFSWIDDSATSLEGQFGLSDLTPLMYAGQSEGYTQLNGLRLAEAIKLALAPDYFTDQGLIHLLGHSHGSKVATVAALELQQEGVPLTQLTLFESPEAGPAPVVDGSQFPPLHLPGLGGAQNFLWYYLDEMSLTTRPVTGRTPVPPVNGRFPTFVDSYFSQVGFGSALSGYPGLGNIVDVGLHAEVLYPLPSIGAPDFDTKLMATVFGSHDYPPPWYAQASLESVPPADGLGWSPLINPQGPPTPGLYEQTWTQPVFSQQFKLSGRANPPSYTPTFTPLQYATAYTVGTASDDGASMTLGVDGATSSSILAMTFNPQAATTGIPGNGMDFQVQFSGVDPGEQVQLVVWIRGQTQASVPIASIDAGTLGYQSIPLFVMDGGTVGATQQNATISLDGFLSGVQSAPILGPFSAAQIPLLGFSLVGAAGSNASVTVSNLRQFSDGVNTAPPVVPSASALAIGAGTQFGGTAGQALPAFTVLVNDAFGKPFTASSVPVTVTVTGPGGFAAGSTTVQSSNGIATFSGLVLNTAGTYSFTFTAPGFVTSAVSGSFTVTAGAASKLTVSTPATTTAGQALAPIAVTVQDAQGNPITGAVVLITASGPGVVASGTPVAVSANGVATLPGLVLQKAGIYTLTATVLGGPGVTSTAFVVRPAAARRLAFTVEPDNVNVRQTLRPLTVVLLDAFGNVVTSSTAPVTLRARGRGRLVGVTTVLPVRGIATFRRLVVTLPGRYSLFAASGGLVSASSRSFTVRALAPYLELLRVPRVARVGVPLPSIQVQLFDQLGQPLLRSRIPITIRLPFTTGVLTRRTDERGVATFPGLVLRRAGSFVMSASSEGLLRAVSKRITVLNAVTPRIGSIG
jgi:hypothetical protein